MGVDGLQQPLLDDGNISLKVVSNAPGNGVVGDRGVALNILPVDLNVDGGNLDVQVHLDGWMDGWMGGGVCVFLLFVYSSCSYMQRVLDCR